MNIQPLNSAYAHNDSVYNLPLWDALNLGYTFIEVDLHLIKDELYCYHRRPIFPKKNNTLTNLYLSPLFDLYKKNNGFIYSGYSSPIFLFLDFKTDAIATYQCLEKTIQPFSSMLSHWTNDIANVNAISLVISGNRPIEFINSQNKRSVLIDGRLADLEKNYKASLMPFVSENYSKIFGRSFFSKMPSEKKLFQFQKIVRQIHTQQKQIRLWNIPENEMIWNTLLQNGLDIISSDKIKKLYDFIYNNKLT